jgi:hypothetical protein
MRKRRTDATSFPCMMHEPDKNSLDQITNFLTRALKHSLLQAGILQRVGSIEKVRPREIIRHVLCAIQHKNPIQR